MGLDGIQPAVMPTVQTIWKDLFTFGSVCSNPSPLEEASVKEITPLNIPEPKTARSFRQRAGLRPSNLP